MDDRLELHEEFCDILGSRNAYFQPPASVSMNYPCIRYSKTSPDVKRANNGVYRVINRYEATVIDPDPDSDIPYKILNRFRMCTVDRSYKADNLNHTVLTIYY